MPAEINAQRASLNNIMSDQRTYIIITSGEVPLKKISAELKKKGFTIESTLEAIGQIIGKGNEKMKKEAMKIKGISDISESHQDFDIGPPDSKITW
jgi:regulator of extracellular matrix RemA (YlzA/DUF370 family)